MSKVVKVFQNGLVSLVSEKAAAIGQSVLAIGAGIVTGNPALIVAGVSNLSRALQSGSGNQARQAQATSLSLGEVGREAVFGEVLTGGSLTNAFNWGGKYGTDWEALVIALADHPCEALVGFYVGDDYYAYAGPGAVTGFKNQLTVKWFDGAEDQAVGDDMANHGGYGATDNLAGMSYVLVSYKADASDAKNPVFPGGRPKLSFRLRGKRCYQARKDSTVPGGSGLHRWADPATWEWTDNPIDCRYNWVRGVFACDRVDQPGQLLVGRGLSAIEAPPERVAAAANVCDELVPLAAGGSERRYRVGAIVNALDGFDAVEDAFAAACAGVVLQPEGSLEIEPGHAKAPVAYITDADLIVGKPVIFSDFRSEADEAWCNTVMPRYIEPAQRWADHAAPIRRAGADVMADGGPRERTVTLPFVTSGTQAQRCGEVVRRLGRLWRTAAFTLGPRFSHLEEGDWIVFTSARRTGGLPVTFRIEAYALDEARQNTLSLREISGAVFAWSAANEIADGATAEAQIVPSLDYLLGPGRGAHMIIGADEAYPVTTTETTIVIAAFNGTLDDGRIIAFPAGEITGLANAANYRLFYALESFEEPVLAFDGTPLLGADDKPLTSTMVAGTYRAVPMPALSELANSAFAAVRRVTTADDGGVYPPSSTPPPGDGGTGYGGGGDFCPTEDALFLLADTARRAPGAQIPAGEVSVGDWAWTRHETTGAWGAYRVVAVSRHRAAVIRAEAERLPQALPAVPVSALRASSGHRIGGVPWTRIDQLGEPDGEAIVVSITVERAHTYLVNGVLSHNAKPTGGG